MGFIVAISPHKRDAPASARIDAAERSGSRSAVEERRHEAFRCIDPPAGSTADARSKVRVDVADRVRATASRRRGTTRYGLKVPR